MDPFLEKSWLDVHTILIAESRKALNHSLPGGLVARVEERLAIESDDGEYDAISPDIRVFSPSTSDPAERGGSVVIEAPFKLVVRSDPMIERFIRIIDKSGTLITVLEFVSPSNKRKPGLNAFRDKRLELLGTGVHFVEIDLVRSGDWRALMRPERCPTDAVALNRAIVRTCGDAAGAYLFPIRLRDPLPEIPIPLRPGDPTVKVPLQPILNAVYDDGRYAATADYSIPLDPPLEPEDAAFALEILSGSSR